MRILKTVHSLNPAGGGVATAVDALTRAELTLGHTVEIACLDHPLSPWLTDRPYPVQAFAPTRFRSYGWSPEFSNWLFKHASRFDAIIVEGLWQYHGPATRLAALAAKVPYIVYPHGMLDPWFRQAYPLKHVKKVLYWKLRGHQVLRDARAVAFTTDEEMRLAENSFQPWQARAVISPLGVPLPLGDPVDRVRAWQKQFSSLSEKKILLFLGRIDPKKGADLLISAYAATYSAEARAKGRAPVLVLAGPENNADYSAHCRDLIATLNLREGVDVCWTGLLNNDLKWAALEAADALVLPSHQENFGYVVAEALAIGTPVLISNKVNLWREVTTDGAGLAAADDLTGTRQLLDQYRLWSQTDRARFSACALLSFERRYQIDAAAQRQVDVLGGAN